MPNSTPQNWVMRFQISRPVITYTVSIITSIHTRPSVSGTNRKWYSAVIANCSRDRSTVAGSIMAGRWDSGQVELLHDGRGRRGTGPGFNDREPEHQEERQLDDDDEANLPAVATAFAGAEPRWRRRRRHPIRFGAVRGVLRGGGGLGHDASE